MQSIVLKIGGKNANGVMQKAKRAFCERELARETKEYTKKDAMICGMGTAGFTMGALTMGPLAPVSAVGVGFFGSRTVRRILDSLKESKKQKQASKVLNETINIQDFRNVLNRFLSKKGKQGIPDNATLVIPNVDGENLLGVISKDDARYIGVLNRMRLCSNPKEDVIVCGFKQ